MNFDKKVPLPDPHLCEIRLICKFCTRPFTEIQKPSKRHPAYCSFSCRFFSKVQKTKSCWIWTASTNIWGYGKIRVSKDKEISTHRAAWEMLIGPIPEGLQVCHNCPGGDNRLCVNPDHLFLGTPKENMQDASKKGRMCRGERNNQAKLSEEFVKQILERSKSGETSTELGKFFGVSRQTIWVIRTRRGWKHI